MEKRIRTNRRYSAEFKIGVILDKLEHHLGYAETVYKYWNVSNSVEAHLYKDNVVRWERIYLEQGEAGLMEERRGRSRGPGKGRPPKLSKEAEEDLIAEVQRLRMENEYLKKLSALVLADERAKRRKRRSSQN